MRKNFRALGFFFVIGFFLLCLICPSESLAFGEKSKGRKAMEVGEYQKAIQFFEKISHKGDLDVNIWLATCYEKTGMSNKASDKFKALSKNHPPVNDRIALAYLECAKESSHGTYNRLTNAASYANNPSTIREIGNYAKYCAKNSKGNTRKQYLNLAAKTLGPGAVYDVVVKSIGENLYQVDFYTDEPVSVFERWNHGDAIKLICEKNEKVYFEDPDLGNQLDLFPIGFNICLDLSGPIRFKYKNGGKLKMLISQDCE